MTTRNAKLVFEYDVPPESTVKMIPREILPFHGQHVASRFYLKSSNTPDVFMTSVKIGGEELMVAGPGIPLIYFSGMMLRLVFSRSVSKDDLVVSVTNSGGLTEHVVLKVWGGRGVLG